ncbi:hypothetical protein [Roseicyclus sp.]|uniref:hypothetical protein n=1 Tax=Roseicyclus sp. TaxID=1914329 RepID=UPI001BCEBB08|nr:hypothetical protein [Roseicyclus sp.]
MGNSPACASLRQIAWGAAHEIGHGAIALGRGPVTGGAEIAVKHGTCVDILRHDGRAKQGEGQGKGQGAHRHHSGWEWAEHGACLRYAP